MKRLPLSLLLAAPLTLGAQETVTLDQSLGFSYSGSQASMGALNASNATTQANYQFDLGMPILAYRLGALSFGGSLGYIKQSSEVGTDSALGLNTIGVSGSLFPYQPYHLTFDYSRSKGPDLFEGGSQVGQTFGLGLIYRGDWVQNLQMTYRHGSVSGASGVGAYSSWSLSDNERRGGTEFRINADRQEAVFGVGSTWRSTALTVATHTQLKGIWSLNNSVSTMVYQGSTSVQAGSALTGTYGPWTSMSSLDATYTDAQNQTVKSAGLSQSLARSWGRFSAFSQLGLSGGASSDSTGASFAMGNLSVGGSFKLSAEWTLMADLSGGWGATKGAVQNRTSSQGSPRSMHVALAWGGGIPEMLRHAMFYWSNLRFQRRLEEDYPPEYLPPEMARVQMRRRHDQQGSMQFSTDFYRIQNGGPGRQDWFRIQGGLQFSNGLMLQTVGDMRKDDRFSNLDRSILDTHLTLHGAYGFGRTSLTFGLGYSKSTLSEDKKAQDLEVDFQRAGDKPTKASSYYALGATSSLVGVPIGITLLRNTDPLGLKTTSLLTYASSSFGKTSFSLNYQHGWRSDGLRTSQVSVNLARWFDTIALWGFGD